MFLRMICHENLFLSNLLSVLIGHRNGISVMIRCLQQDLGYHHREKKVKGDRKWSQEGFQWTFEVMMRVKVKEEEMICRERHQEGHGLSSETLMGLGKDWGGTPSTVF